MDIYTVPCKIISIFCLPPLKHHALIILNTSVQSLSQERCFHIPLLRRALSLHFTRKLQANKQ